MSKVLGVIPVRMDSKRFPGKPLADINGKPMIQHVYERSKQAKLVDEVIVASGDLEIIKTVAHFEGSVFLNDYVHSSGTSRVAELAKYFPEHDIVINIQGDLPLIPPELLDSVVMEMRNSEEVEVATLAAWIIDPDVLNNPNIVKVTLDENSYAINFGRTVLLWEGENYMHIGVYGYRRDFLLKLVELPESEREKMLSLEQYRVLDNGHKIKVIRTLRIKDVISVDVPEDLEKVKKVMEETDGNFS